jgi:GNAT superfamily N-acetyltransferase
MWRAYAQNGPVRELPAGIEVRNAGPDDIETVHAFVLAGLRSYAEWAPGWEPAEPPPEQMERMRANFSNPDAWILMAFEREQIVGVASMAAATVAAADPPPPGTIYLWQMFVAPRWHGRGLAGALHDLATAEARRRGFDRMVLWAAEGARQARRFYEREGWRPTGERDPDSKLGLPLVQYELSLR